METRSWTSFSQYRLFSGFWRWSSGRLMGFMMTGGPAVRGQAWNLVSVASHHSFSETVFGMLPVYKKNNAALDTEKRLHRHSVRGQSPPNAFLSETNVSHRKAMANDPTRNRNVSTHCCCTTMNGTNLSRLINTPKCYRKLLIWTKDWTTWQAKWKISPPLIAETIASPYNIRLTQTHNYTDKQDKLQHRENQSISKRKRGEVVNYWRKWKYSVHHPHMYMAEQHCRQSSVTQKYADECPP